MAAASGSNAAEVNAMGLVLSTSPCGPEMAAMTGVAIAVSCTVVVAFAGVPCSMRMTKLDRERRILYILTTCCLALQQPFSTYPK